MPSCVLAYSGGLDTSVILSWVMDQGYDVHAVYVDLGQPCEDREAILNKARDAGAASARIVDAREELCRDFAFPVLKWQAKYESIYLLGTSIARPLISKKCLQVARDLYEAIEVTTADYGGQARRGTADGGGQIVDWPEALTAVQGDRALLRELAEVFLQDYGSLLLAARTALTCGDAARLQRTSHTLRGAVRQFCAQTVEEGCDDLERAAGNDKLIGALETLAALECKIGQLAEALRAWLAEQVEGGYGGSDES